MDSIASVFLSTLRNFSKLFSEHFRAFVSGTVSVIKYQRLKIENVIGHLGLLNEILTNV